jgi:hypothetical protein
VPSCTRRVDRGHDHGVIDDLEVPTHRRTIQFEVAHTDDELVIRGHLKDERPWAKEAGEVECIHDMTLTVRVRRADLTITEAVADMARFPHAECSDIEAAFGGLAGLSVGRGYTRAVSERFGRQLGCTHLEFLARALGPVVVQALPSSALREARGRHEDLVTGAGLSWLADTCHVWSSEGPGPQKVALGWRPGPDNYPAPRLATLTDEAAG